MRISGSEILAGVSGTLNATPEFGDTDISVPPVLMPVVNLPAPTTYGLSLGSGAALALAVQNNSHLIGYIGTRTAGQGPITDRIVRLGQGLWRVNLAYSAFCPAAAESCYLENAISTPSGSGGGSGRFFDLSISGQISVCAASFEAVISVPKDHAYIVTALMNNTSGVTNMRIAVTGFAAKLG